MEKVELGRHITTTEDIGKIRFEHEKKVAALLLTTNPDLQIIYEPRKYEVDKETAEKEQLRKYYTVPDFGVRNPATGKEFILEVTEQRRASAKNKQREIFRLVTPNIPFIVFSP